VRKRDGKQIMCVRKTRLLRMHFSCGSSCLRFFFAPNSLYEYTIAYSSLSLSLSPTPPPPPLSLSLSSTHAEKQILFRVTELTGRLTPSFGFSARSAPPTSSLVRMWNESNSSSLSLFFLSLPPRSFSLESRAMYLVPRLHRTRRVELRHFEYEDKREAALRKPVSASY